HFCTFLEYHLHISILVMVIIKMVAFNLIKKFYSNDNIFNGALLFIC
ncbi:hypothetical protein HMPREF3233_00551, partial [Veillonella atypica]